MLNNILSEIYIYYNLNLEKNEKVLKRIEKFFKKFFITTIVVLLIPFIWVFKKIRTRLKK